MYKTLFTNNLLPGQRLVPSRDPPAATKDAHFLRLRPPAKIPLQARARRPSNDLGRVKPDNIWACQNYKDRAAEGSGAHSRGTSQMRSLHLSVLGTSSNHTGCESDPPPSYLIVD